MHKRTIHKMKVIMWMLACLFVFTGCSEPKAEVIQKQPEKIVKIAPGAYDSADKAIVIDKQENSKTITLLNLEKKRTYTLHYDGITNFMDKYGTQITVGQLAEGEMAEVLFLKEEKMLTSLTVSSDVWVLNDVGKFELDLNAGRMKIMEEYYTLDENTVVLSRGELKEFMDIHQGDILQIRGRDHEIHSITIQEGHGYLRLVNEEYFLGGWIEVGQKIIQRIEEDMLLVIPEGNYEVYLSHTGIEGTKEVEITRNKETKLDVGDLKKDDLIKYGNLIFTIQPSTAKVYMDGKEMDVSRVVKAEYGLHQIMAKEEGYDTLIQYIRVNENNANVAMTLEETADHTLSDNVSEEESDTSEDTDKTEEKKDGSAAGYKVTIEEPQGAEVYVDGNYIGIAPVSYKKKTGSQQITIRKSGYLTRNYTIDVDDEKKDISYSFSELTPIE